MTKKDLDSLLAWLPETTWGLRGWIDLSRSPYNFVFHKIHDFLDDISEELRIPEPIYLVALRMPALRSALRARFLIGSISADGFPGLQDLDDYFNQFDDAACREYKFQFFNFAAFKDIQRFTSTFAGKSQYIVRLIGEFGTLQLDDEYRFALEWDRRLVYSRG